MKYLFLVFAALAVSGWCLNPSPAHAADCYVCRGGDMEDRIEVKFYFRGPDNIVARGQSRYLNIPIPFPMSPVRIVSKDEWKGVPFREIEFKDGNYTPSLGERSGAVSRDYVLYTRYEVKLLYRESDHKLRILNWLMRKWDNKGGPTRTMIVSNMTCRND